MKNKLNFVAGIIDILAIGICVKLGLSEEGNNPVKSSTYLADAAILIPIATANLVISASK